MDRRLPSTPITPVNRSDESGTTESFTEYLATAAPQAWPHEPSAEWPVSGGEAAQGTSGVVGAVRGGNGTIGYADASQAQGLGVANVKVGSQFVGYTPKAAVAVVEASRRVPDRGEHDYAIDLARDTSLATEGCEWRGRMINTRGAHLTPVITGFRHPHPETEGTS